ncbi:MAG: hypothetical protein GF331_23640 [Chitinivibrionales bacterium]|nr:hypothetical protein [Chitinivibrionales bacterium]
MSSTSILCTTTDPGRTDGWDKPVNQSLEHRKELKRYDIPGHAHALTFSCYHRRSYFDDPIACEVFLGVLNEARELYEYKLWAYVVMPNHVHVLLWPMRLTYDIAKICGGLKGVASKRYHNHLMENDPLRRDGLLVRAGGKNVFRFWQHGGGFDRNLWKADAVHDVIRYIEANPVRRKLVDIPEQYRWSSAYARATNQEPVPDRFGMPVTPSHGRRSC